MQRRSLDLRGIERFEKMFVAGHLPPQMHRRVVGRRRNVKTLAIRIRYIRTLNTRTRLHQRSDFVSPRRPHVQLIERICWDDFQCARTQVSERFEILWIAGPPPGRPEDRQHAATIIRRFLVIAKSDRDVLLYAPILPMREKTIRQLSDELFHRWIAVVINQHDPRMEHESGTRFRPTPRLLFGHLDAIIVRSLEVAMARAVDAGEFYN